MVVVNNNFKEEIFHRTKESCLWGKLCGLYCLGAESAVIACVNIAHKQFSRLSAYVALCLLD